TVSDINLCINSWAKYNKKHPDLILLPSSIFDVFGFDITGEHYKKIEYLWETPVELIKVAKVSY
ncbi:MAG: hypothetical protein ACOCRK_08685, partial [bacterium]